LKTIVIVCSAALAMTLSLLAGGCQAQPKEEAYKQVSLGQMKVSIPADWERTKKFERYMAAFAGGSGEYATALKADQYFDPRSGDAFLMIMTLDMKRYSESIGTPWKGWESIWKYFPQEEYVAMTYASIIPEVGSLTRLSDSQLTVNGYPAWESQFTGKISLEMKRACVRLIFYENDLAALFMLVDEPDWDNYEATWRKIGASVAFAP